MEQKPIWPTVVRIGWTITWIYSIIAAFNISTGLGFVFIVFGVAGPFAALILGFMGNWGPFIVGLITIILGFILLRFEERNIR